MTITDAALFGMLGSAGLALKSLITDTGVPTLIDASDYGVTPGAGDQTANLAAAVAALNAQGGGTLYIPPSTSGAQLLGQIVISGNVPINVFAYGAWLRVPDGGIGVDVNNGHGESAAGATIEGLHVKGATLSTTAIRTTNTDRVRIRDCTIEAVGTGVLHRTTAAGGTDGNEGCGLEHVIIRDSTTGVQYDKSDGSGHFDESWAFDLQISQCTTGMKFGTAAIMIRSSFDLVTYWAPNGGVGFDVDCDMRHVKARWHGEILTGTATFVKWGANASNSEFADLNWEMGSSFGTNPVDNSAAASGAIVVWREGPFVRQLQKGSAGSAVVGAGVGTWSEDHPYPWVYFVGGSPTNAPMPGGQNGGVAWGDGTNAGDVALYRPGAGRIKSTGTLEATGFVMGTKPVVTGSRGGNAALASLLTALASIGLITDSSSA